MSTTTAPAKEVYKTEVISKEGAAIEVTRIILTPAQRKRLTLKRLPAPKPAGATTKGK